MILNLWFYNLLVSASIDNLFENILNNVEKKTSACKIRAALNNNINDDRDAYLFLTLLIYCKKVFQKINNDEKNVLELVKSGHIEWKLVILSDLFI